MLRSLIMLALAAQAQTVRVVPQGQAPLAAVVAPSPLSSLKPTFVPSLISLRPTLLPAVKPPQVAAAMAVAKMTEGMDVVKQAAPDAAKLGAPQASRMGEESFGVLAGRAPALVAPDMGQTHYWGKVAGESISAAAAAHFGRDEEEPAAPVLSAPVPSPSNPVVAWIRKAGSSLSSFVIRKNPFRK